MTNVVFGVVFILFSLSGVITFVMTFRRRKESESSIWLMLLSVTTVIWILLAGSFYLIPDDKIAYTLHEQRYGLIMLSSWFIYLFIYQTFKRHMFSRLKLAALFIFPLIDIIVVLTNSRTGWFITYDTMTVFNGLKTPVFKYGPMFYYHCAFAYIPICLSLVMSMRQLILLPSKRKKPVAVLLAAIVLVVIATVVAILDILPYKTDLAPLFIQATQAILYFALFNLHSVDMMLISRDAVFENTSSALLVLDNNGKIIDHNRKAQEIASKINKTELLGASCGVVVEQWQESAHCRVFESNPSIFSLVEEEKETHYQINEFKIYEKLGTVMGSYVEITNISPIMTLIHMLQDAAYYDSLTGLPNRNYFVKKLEEIDKPEFLPLCVVVGDVNGLKIVNDTFGHVKGDELLKDIAHLLVMCAPDNAFVARIGGDEYVGLLPNISKAIAEKFVAEVEGRSSELEDPALKGASISLGYKIKYQAEENITELMKAADMEMYTSKRDRRAKRE